MAAFKKLNGSGVRKILLAAGLWVLVGNILVGQVVGDYRSAVTGNWNVRATWERWNGASWQIPSVPQGTPNNTSGVITIQNGHTVTVTVSVSVDQVIVNAGGQVTVNPGQTLTIANGAGTDMTVIGTLVNSWTITTTGILAFGSGSTYQHAQNGGTIPTATWNAASNCNITGVSNSIPTGLNQTFGNFTWNCPAHVWKFILAIQYDNCR